MFSGQLGEDDQLAIDEPVSHEGAKTEYIHKNDWLKMRNVNKSYVSGPGR